MKDVSKDLSDVVNIFIANDCFDTSFEQSYRMWYFFSVTDLSGSIRKVIVVEGLLKFRSC